MNIDEFFDRKAIYALNPELQTFVREQINHIKDDPVPFVVGGINAFIDHGKNDKSFILGLLIGFAASDSRVKVKDGDE